MTSKDFKSALQAELKTAGFTNKIEKVGDDGIHTIIRFTNPVGQKLKSWLNNRFTHGITISANYDCLVCINTPNENNKAVEPEQPNVYLHQIQSFPAVAPESNIGSHQLVTMKILLRSGQSVLQVSKSTGLSFQRVKNVMKSFRAFKPGSVVKSKDDTRYLVVVDDPSNNAFDFVGASLSKSTGTTTGSWYTDEFELSSLSEFIQSK